MEVGLGASCLAAGVTAFLNAAIGSGMEALTGAGAATLTGAAALAGAAATTLGGAAATTGRAVAPSAAATAGVFSSVLPPMALATDGCVERVGVVMEERRSETYAVISPPYFLFEIVPEERNTKTQSESTEYQGQRPRDPY